VTASLRLRRAPLLALALASLLAALWGGLQRLGWALPPLALVAGLHGPLMVSGFLGTLIALERAAALELRWAYAAPVATGLGSLAAALGVAAPGAALTTAGSAVLLAVFGVLQRRRPEPFLATMALGAASWVVGNALWLAGWPVFHVVPWWAGFLVLTIAGERQELARLLAPPRTARLAFAAATALLLGGQVVSAFHLDAGTRTAGAGMLALALWLARHDMARRTVRQEGLARFMAVCLLSGYAWLALAGILALVSTGLVAGPRYDAALHALFLGFVFAMIFGHAPVIFPGILGVAIPFRRRFYGHLVALHVTLALRVAGDLLLALEARRWGGLLNAVSVLAFLLNTASAALAARARNG
jgi:hypothetical protein